MDIDKHANWLLGAFHTSAWFVTNHGKLYFLCSRGPYVKLFLDRAISHVSLVQISQGAGGILWAIDNNGQIWVRLKKNPIALGSKECVEIGVTEVVYENQRFSASKKNCVSTFSTPYGAQFEALSEITLPSNRWKWDTEWTFDRAPDTDSDGWVNLPPMNSSIFLGQKYVAVTFTCLKSIRWKVRQRVWLRTRSVIYPDQIWYQLHSWSSDRVLSLSVSRWGVWIILENFKIAFREGMDDLHPEGCSFETIEVPEYSEADRVCTPCIASNQENTTWLVAPDGRVYYRNEVTRSIPMGKKWIRVNHAPKLTSIEVSSKCIIGVTVNGDISVCTASNYLSKKGKWLTINPPLANEPEHALEYLLLYAHDSSQRTKDIDNDLDDYNDYDEFDPHIQRLVAEGGDDVDDADGRCEEIISRDIFSSPLTDNIEESLSHSENVLDKKLRRATRDHDSIVFANAGSSTRLVSCKVSDRHNYLVCIDDHGRSYIRNGLTPLKPTGQSWRRIEFPFSHTEGIGINCCSLGSMPFLGDVPLPYTTFNRWQRYFLAKLRSRKPWQMNNYLTLRYLPESSPTTRVSVKWFNNDIDCKLSLDLRSNALILDVMDGDCKRHKLPLLSIRTVRPSAKMGSALRLDTTAKHFQTVLVCLNSVAERKDWVILIQRWVLRARRLKQQQVSSALLSPSMTSSNTKQDKKTQFVLDKNVSDLSVKRVVAPVLWAIDHDNIMWYCDLVAEHLISEVGELSPILEKISYRDAKDSSKIQFTPKLYWHRTAELVCETQLGPRIIDAANVVVSPAGLVWVISCSGRAFALVKEAGTIRKAWAYQRMHTRNVYDKATDLKSGRQTLVNPSSPRKMTINRDTSARGTATNSINAREKRHLPQFSPSLTSQPWEHISKGLSWLPVPSCHYQLAYQSRQELLKEVALTLTMAWAITTSGFVFVLHNVTIENPTGLHWEAIECPELATSINAQDGSITILTNQGHVYTRVGFDFATPAGTHWETDHGAITSPHLSKLRPDTVVDKASAIQNASAITHNETMVCVLGGKVMQIGLRSTYGSIIWQCRSHLHDLTCISGDGYSHIWGIDSQGYLRSFSLNFPTDLHRKVPLQVSLEIPGLKEKDSSYFLDSLVWKCFSHASEEELRFTSVSACCAKPRQHYCPPGHVFLGDDTFVPARKSTSLGAHVLQQFKTKQFVPWTDIHWHYIVTPVSVNTNVLARNVCGHWYEGKIVKVVSLGRGDPPTFFLVNTLSPDFSNASFWVDGTRITPRIVAHRTALFIGLCVLVPKSATESCWVLADITSIDDECNTITVEAAEANLKPNDHDFKIDAVFIGPFVQFRGIAPVPAMF